ncbi:MAG TPA: hypothetical protein PLK94_10995, partial [Alphaproteobacteria bacterium]|nr:hypothetical protein [Alphaproteobacteria bacterium]
MKNNRFEKLERLLVPLLQTKEADKKQGFRVRFFLWFLKQFSNIYRAIVKIRLFFYRKGIFRHHT